MIENRRVFAIIPARGGSQRLPRKNIFPIWGKPMIFWAIQACHVSEYIDRVYVSSEDEEILSIAESFGAYRIQRPMELADGFTYKQDVIAHAAQSLEEKPELIISLQANSPQICPTDLDGAITKLVQYDRKEIFTVSDNLIQNAAFRVMDYDYVFQKTISTYCGVYITNYQDVHDKDDVDDLETNAQPCKQLIHLME